MGKDYRLGAVEEVIESCDGGSGPAAARASGLQTAVNVAPKSLCKTTARAFSLRASDEDETPGGMAPTDSKPETAASRRAGAMPLNFEAPIVGVARALG